MVLYWLRISCAIWSFGVSWIFHYVRTTLLVMLLNSTFSLRHYFVWMRQDNLLGEIQDLLSSVKTHNFQSLSLEPHIKDGGIFVRFSYTTGNSQTPLDDILKDLRSQVKKRGGVPSWNGVPRGEVWLVQGRPWREVCNYRFLYSFSEARPYRI